MAKPQRLRRAQGGRDAPRRPDATSRPIRFSGASTSDRRASGARSLQVALAARLAEQASGSRWSTRRTLAFILLVSLALWGGVIGAVTWLLRLIA